MSRPRSGKAAAAARSLTIPDLVVLSLLAERPMHGYEAVAELERRQIRDWASVSRPQVYYSLEKLARLGLVRPTADDAPAAGPERRVLATSAAGRTALADALERHDWTTQRDRPAFATWMALSWLARPDVFAAQLEKRRSFLDAEIARAKATLRSVEDEVGHPYHEAVWILTLFIDQLTTERKWIAKVVREAPKRAPARRPKTGERTAGAPAGE